MPVARKHGNSGDIREDDDDSHRSIAALMWNISLTMPQSALTLFTQPRVYKSRIPSASQDTLCLHTIFFWAGICYIVSVARYQFSGIVTLLMSRGNIHYIHLKHLIKSPETDPSRQPPCLGHDATIDPIMLMGPVIV